MLEHFCLPQCCISIWKRRLPHGHLRWSSSLFAFRQQLIKLISSMRRLSYKDGSREIFASWEEGLQELKEIEEATEAEERLPSPRQTNDFDKLLALAKVNSRSAVIEAWLSVENAARELVEPFHKGSRPLGSPFMVERELWQRELIGPWRA